MAELRKIVRIAGTDLDGDKKLVSSLHKIRGVHFMLANAVMNAVGIDSNRKVGDLKPEELKKLEGALMNPIAVGVPPFLVNRRRDPETGENMHAISADLMLRHDFDIKFMKKIKTYKGVRHSLGLRVRGQRTKSTGRRGSAMGVKRRKSVK